jgi:hypothetical protein
MENLAVDNIWPNETNPFWNTSVMWLPCRKWKLTLEKAGPPSVLLYKLFWPNFD